MKKYHSVQDFIDDLSQEDHQIFTLVRSYIFEAAPSLTENLKWNAPNYVHNGQDRITFNIMNKNKTLRVILHKGAKEAEDKTAKPIMDDPDHLIRWNSNIRGTLEFTTLADVQKNHQKLVALFRRWLVHGGDIQ
jgi:hypothetical protein